MRLLPICLTVALFVSLRSEALADASKKSDSAKDSPEVVGWIEKVYFSEIDAKLQGKMDTGANTSSVRAEILDVRESDKKKKGKDDSKKAKSLKSRKRVIFSLEDDDGKKFILERKVVRWVKIKKKAGGYQRRAVVKLKICIAGKATDAEFTLAERQNFIYPVLIGRNVLSKQALVVDSNATYETKASCPDQQQALYEQY